MSTPEDSVAAAEGDSPAPSAHARRSASVLGLSLISGLNIVCLVFLVSHFVGHQDKSVQMPIDNKRAEIEGVDRTPPNTEIVAASKSQGHSPGLADTSGNIEFAPASKLVLSIASGIDTSIQATANQERRETSSRPTPSEPNTEHWVQLGALSKQLTATSYWSNLKKRHAALLQNQTPRYFGPNEVGGSLFHIRLGPMPRDHAEGLCDKLRTDGADCFCVHGMTKGISS